MREKGGDFMLTHEGFKKLWESPEIQRFVQQEKTTRFHIYTDTATKQKVLDACEFLNVNQGDYLVCVLLSFDVRGIPDKLQTTLEKTNKLLRSEKVKFPKKAYYGLLNKKKGDIPMAKKVSDVRTEQFHMRVSKACYDEIKARASSYSMTVSDYVMFVLTHYDVYETNRRVDEINDKLDELAKVKNEINDRLKTIMKKMDVQ